MYKRATHIRAREHSRESERDISETNTRHYRDNKKPNNEQIKNNEYEKVY